MPGRGQPINVRTIRYKPIGVIHSDLKEIKGAPIQSVQVSSVRGRVEVFPKYEKGLQGISGFSHIILLCHFHKASKAKSLLATPFLDDRNEHGILATRAPARPNPIGLSIVKVEGVKRNIVFVRNLDIVDGTPLLDIKPYVPKFDSRKKVKIGWYGGRLGRLADCRSDERFCS